ncbi:unnamed protein product [Aspergillus oryzae]|nr:unnamed protein product [Aspergillus oryzae]GMF95116.1 unnamed protein product [Aspergillus oryzae]
MQPNTTSPRDQNNIDPAISGAAMLSGPPQTPPQPEPTGQESPKTYGKRPLSTSKRAAQNRAAQRKESYIRKLEEQVKEFDTMSEAFKALQAENYQLREYIINLQSRLLESQGEVPELPGNIDLSQPRTDLNVPQPGAGPATTSSSAPAPPSGAQQAQPPQGAASNDDMNSLNRIAVAGLGMRKHPNEEANYLGNNFTGRRTRPDETQADSEVTKTEQAPHGLPMVS